MSISTVRSVMRAKVKPAMWVGSVDDLSKLIVLCRELEATARDYARQSLVKTESERKTKFLARGFRKLDELETLWADENNQQLVELPKRLVLEMQVVKKSYGTELDGNPEEILAELDRPQEVKSIILRLGKEYVDSYLGFQSGFRIVIDRFGASVSTFGARADWIDLSTNKIRTSIRHQRPWFYWVQNFWFVFLAMTFPPVFASTAATYALQGSTLSTVLALADAAVIIAVTTFNFLVWPRLVPMFELLAPSKRPRGAVAVGAIVSTVLWIVSTLVVPILLSRHS